VKGRDLSRELGVLGRIILKWILKRLLTGFIWLIIEISGGLL
jgi:hypothetical protein